MPEERAITSEDGSNTVFAYDRGQLDRVTNPDGIYKDFDYDTLNGKLGRIEGNPA